jgi:hypothetical protein
MPNDSRNICEDVMIVKYVIYIQARASTHWILLHYSDMISLQLYNVMSKCLDIERGILGIFFGN